MRAAVEVQSVEPVAPSRDWSLWMRQIRAILRIEVKKNFWGRRAILIYLLAAIPVFLTFLLTFGDSQGVADIRRHWTSAQTTFAHIYRVLILFYDQQGVLGCQKRTINTVGFYFIGQHRNALGRINIYGITY